MASTVVILGAMDGDTAYWHDVPFHVTMKAVAVDDIIRLDSGGPLHVVRGGYGDHSKRLHAFPVEILDDLAADLDDTLADYGRM
jgi:hypothetical protein